MSKLCGKSFHFNLSLKATAIKGFTNIIIATRGSYKVRTVQ